jgi:hypothetical protein
MAETTILCKETTMEIAMKPLLTRIRKPSRLYLIAAALLASSAVTAQDATAPATGGEVSVPLNPARDVYFGNFHIHTAWSFDAYINGAASGPDGAYRWAKGEVVPGGGDGTPLKIKVPLDWYIVSDHAEYLGALPLMGDPDSPVSKHPLAPAISGDDPKASFDAYTEILDGISNRRNDEILGDPELAKSIWKQVVEIADKHYEPGDFTTFAGFEWTSNPGWRNLHRVVFFADTDNLPAKPISAIDSDVPEDLWKWMDAQRAKGAELLAIPHNGNASDGLMFPVETSYGGSSLDKGYAEARMRNETLYEITQIKGTSEVYPALSPNDEFAGFELWDYTLASTATPPEHKRGGYVREALIRGLQLQQDGKGNPFKYGFIGDSDTHNSAAAIEEDNYTGKFGFENDPKHRLNGPPGVSKAAAKQVRQFSSGGVAAVWARANTREEIFAAIARKETYATSGPRMKVRFFGGYGFEPDTVSAVDWLDKAYSIGVPMGGDLLEAPQGKSPTFIVAAMKEADGANLDRVQVIKGWVDAKGQTHEKIYNVALSGDRKADEKGKAPAVGNTVDAKTATYSNTIGADELLTVWSDPDFDPEQYSVYYARVLQIPTPRWSTYDAVRTGLERPEDLPVSIQERAWTSPIWYTP